MDSLDDVIYHNDGDVNRHETIGDAYDLEEEFERKKVVDLILKKCNTYLSEIAFDILLHDTLTDQLSNIDLAKKYNCCCSRISSIKKNQINPTLDRIRAEVKAELGYTM